MTNCQCTFPGSDRLALTDFHRTVIFALHPHRLEGSFPKPRARLGSAWPGGYWRARSSFH